jgi:hypothetical protein
MADEAGLTSSAMVNGMMLYFCSVSSASNLLTTSRLVCCATTSGALRVKASF